MSGNGKQCYRIKFDDLPADDQVVYVCPRHIITVINEGKEDVECDDSNTDLDVIEGSERKGTRRKRQSKKICVITNNEVTSTETFVL